MARPTAMFVMPSKALRRWFKSQAVALDQMENAHTSVGGKGRGRRYTTDQINQAYAVLLASQFQGFCRDLHSESAENLVDILEPPSLRPIVQAEFTRELDTGEKGGKAVINWYILSYDARTTNPKTRTEGRRPEQLTNQCTNSHQSSRRGAFLRNEDSTDRSRGNDFPCAGIV